MFRRPMGSAAWPLRAALLPCAPDIAQCGLALGSGACPGSSSSRDGASSAGMRGRGASVKVLAGRKNSGGATQPQRSKGWGRNKQRAPAPQTHKLDPRERDWAAPDVAQLNPGGTSAGAGAALCWDEAVGQVMAREANFVRVLVQQCWRPLPPTSPETLTPAGGPSSEGAWKSALPSARLGLGADRGGFGECHAGSSRTGAPNSLDSAGAKMHAPDSIWQGASGMLGPGTSADVEQGSLSQAEANLCSKAGGDEAHTVDSRPRVGVEVLCVVRALLKKIQQQVLVGDLVQLSSVDWTELRGVVQSVQPRHSQVRDPPIANVDHLVLLFSLAAPSPEEANLSRFLVAAEATGVPFSLALNKADLASAEDARLWEARIRAWGYDPLLISVQEGRGLGPLRERLRSHVSVVVGPSGVGKSSLINALRAPASSAALDSTTVPVTLGAGRETPSASLGQPNASAAEHRKPNGAAPGAPWDTVRVGEVSQRTGRGRHTTRHVSLLKLRAALEEDVKDCGLLADSPGFSQPSLLDVSSSQLPLLFPEVRLRLATNGDRCSFVDCSHAGEPGCVVGQDWARHQYYLSLRSEIRAREALELRSVGTKRESQVRLKSRGAGEQYAEPKLELKKHRRESRRHAKQALADELEELTENGDIVQ